MYVGSDLNTVSSWYGQQKGNNRKAPASAEKTFYTAETPKVYQIFTTDNMLWTGICAANNSLVLSNKSYYAWTTSSGGKYTWTVNNGRIGWAASESLLAENTNQKGTNYKWEMCKAGNILSDLAQGKSVWGYLYSNEEVLSVCEKVGISPGFFSIDAGAGKHTYLLQESGKTINVDAKIKQLNDINWIEIGYKEGDTFSVYGKEYAIDSSCTSYYASNYKNTVKKTDSEKDSTNTKDGNVTTSTVELKTSRPGVTKTEQIKTGYSNVNDYSKYLQGKYHYMNTGTTSMQGVPTTVSVSSAFLQKCMNDPEKAKYLEENLAAIPDCAKSAVNGCLGTLTNLSYMIDANGNISVAISGTNDPDGKIAKENAERKAKENREKEEKVKEKRAAKKAEEEKAAKKRAEKSAEGKETGDYTLSVTGNDVKSMTQSLVAESVSISAPDRSSFDIKA